jgi:LPLT family lysophospholipid transporter-like MFS transporter
VQGFNENAGMLVMLAVYAGAIGLGLSLKALILGFGVLVALGMVLIYVLYLNCQKSIIRLS